MNAVAKEASTNMDDVFASSALSDAALTAARRVTERFHSSFPGFDLYRYIVAGVEDPKVTGWAMMSARVLAASKGLKGHPYIAKRIQGDWLDQAGLDALHAVPGRRFPASLRERSKEFGVDKETYAAVRNPVAAGMIIGFRMFKTQLHAEYLKVLWEDSSPP